MFGSSARVANTTQTETTRCRPMPVSGSPMTVTSVKREQRHPSVVQKGRAEREVNNEFSVNG